MAKKPKAPAGHPDGFYIHFIRMDNGDAVAHLFDDTQHIKTAVRAAWDDAIPWAAGTYQTTCDGVDVPGKGGAALRFDEVLPYREGVLLHPGLTGKLNYSENPAAPIYYNYGSFGCLVAQKDFIKNAYNQAIGAQQIDANGLADIPIVVTDAGARTNIGVRLTAGAAGDVNEVEVGQWVDFRVKLTGDANGVSKSVAVFIDITSAEVVSFEYAKGELRKVGPVTNQASINHTPIDTPSGYYVIIPRFHTSAEFSLRITSNTSADLDLNLSSYLFNSPRTANGQRWYSDYLALDSGLPKILIQNGGDPKETLSPIQSLDNLNLNVSGGEEGFQETYVAKKGATYHLDFEAYSVPDAIRVFDNRSTYVDSGFISGHLSGDFTISNQSNGRVTIEVTGSGPGTEWNLSAYLLFA